MFSIAYRIGDVEVTLSADTIEGVLALNNAVQSKDSGEWIEWHGGECPVDRDTRVEYRMRKGDDGMSYAKSLRWSHFDFPGDIVAYKVIKNA